ncbi:MAG: tRNA (N(6)-L-threonylcarbamoyladenosine(37)-C(2))-methylthiotransferase MtaB [Thermodesulfobacteriota bacterium]
MKKPKPFDTPRVAFFTLGCKVNQFETACLAEKFKALGWETVSFKEEAELYLINSCAVTAEAQRQSAQMVRQAARNHPDSLIAASGCACQLFPETFQKIRGVDVISGTFTKMDLPDLFGDRKKEEGPRILLQEGTKRPLAPQFPLPGGKTRAFLRIQDGCNGSCSYCLVPKARGGSRSLPEKEVLEGIKFFSAKGVKELVLTGIHLGQYGADLHPEGHLVSLLAKALSSHPELSIRLSSLEPQEISPDFLDLFEIYSNLCPHLHIPLQSGDDGILKKMNRTYSSEYYAELIHTIHKKIPLASIGADVIVGFPGEGEGDFLRTLNFISDLPMSYLHIFPFSPRPGTPAANFPDQINRKVMEERLKILKDLTIKKQQAFIGCCLNREFSALCLQEAGENGWSKVLTENYLTVSIQNRLEKNERTRVVLLSFDRGEIKGAIAGSPEIMDTLPPT